MTEIDLPTPDDVGRAGHRLDGVVHRTPVLTSQRLDAATGGRIHLKAEHLQRVGAFKFRGASNALACLAPEVRARGVVAFSSGNHAQAVARAAAAAGVAATVVMPTDAPAGKVAATRGYGAEVVTYDRDREDRAAIGAQLAERTGRVVVPPFDDATVIAGQGTAAAELLADVADLDVLVAPIGGGGLLAGCALAVAATGRAVRLIGVEPAVRTAARDALRGGDVVEVPVPATLLDGQRTTHIGHRPLAILRAAAAEVVGVEDRSALDAMRWSATALKQVLEPSGAAGLAALLDGGIDVRGQRVGVILSGGNVDPAVLASALTGR